MVDDLEAFAKLDFAALQNFRWLLARGPSRQVWPIITMDAERSGQVISWIPNFRTRIFGRIKDEHVDTFVIMSGDSDFSPLVSKLRENNKEVIGVGVKNSTSDLLIANCDEFIYYDDILRASQRRKPPKAKQPAENGNGKKEPADRKVMMDRRAQQAFEQVLETIDDLVSERGEEDMLWGSMVKQALKRRKPGFNESYHGFRSFGILLEAMQERNMLKLQHDKKSGGYIIEEVT
jgi:hypothetical protein